MRGDELCGGCQRIPLIRPDLADRTSRVVGQQKKESLFFGKKMTKLGQLWVVGVRHLLVRGNTIMILSIMVNEAKNCIL